MWEAARRANPDTSRYFPVIIYGFDGLETRVKLQDEEVMLHRNKLRGDIDQVWVLL